MATQARFLAETAPQRIDQAWVAFGAEARRFAQNNLLRSVKTNMNYRFGRQLDRGGSTSLLIMRIGARSQAMARSKQIYSEPDASASCCRPASSWSCGAGALVCSCIPDNMLDSRHETFMGFAQQSPTGLFENRDGSTIYSTPLTTIAH